MNVQEFLGDHERFRDENASKYSSVTIRGTVFYLGEDVDDYENGKIVGHDGSWLYGKDAPAPGVIMNAKPTVGQKWRTEDVSAEIGEQNEVVSIAETVKTPAGTYENCAKVKEDLADGTVEYKYYAPGVGVVREQPHDGDEFLISHNADPALSAAKPAIQFKEAKLIIEHNATDHDSGNVEVQVVDAGIGIAPELHGKIFDRFTRADASRGQSKGHGLGLSICNAIAKRHHGTVSVASTPGHGSTFTVVLPIA